jgi:hypothetical protein
MKRFALAWSAAATLASLANAWTIHPGLLQAKTGAWNTWEQTAAGAENFAASAIPLECAPGPVMCDTRQSLVNPWTGTTIAWFNGSPTMWSYKGQIYLTAGTTYAFGKYLADGARVQIDGTNVIENGTASDFATGVFVPAETGWHSFDVRAYSVGGSKGPVGGDWGEAMGLAWNTNGITGDGNPATAGWTTIRDSGDASVLRHVDESASPAHIVKAKPTASGYDIRLSLAGRATGTATVGLRAAGGDIAVGGTLGTDWTTASVQFDEFYEEKTVSVPWTAGTEPHVAVYVDGQDAIGGTAGFTGCTPVRPVGDYVAERTISVTPLEGAGGITNFNVVVDGGRAGHSNSLFMAYGAMPGGETPSSWADYTNVATLGAGRQEVDVPVPEGWGETAFNVRFFVADGIVLPYRMEVEYLHSNGNSTFADIGYTMTPTSKVVLRFRYAQQSGGLFFGNGAGTDTRGYYFRFFAIPSNVILDINNEGEGRLWCGPVDPATAYLFEIGNAYVYNANVNMYWGQEGKMPFETLQKPATLMTTYDYGSIYFINIRHNDVDGDVYQAIPVVGWNGQTALYDKISGTIHHSFLEDGFEDFVPGPVVARGCHPDAVNVASALVHLESVWIEEKPVVSKNAQGAFEVHARLETGVGSVKAVYNGTAEQELSASASGPEEFTEPVRPLPTNTTYSCTVVATDASGRQASRTAEDCFYMGGLTVAKTADASETYLSVPGTFVVSRADTNGNLAVNYTLSGTAAAGTNYLALSGSAVIPRGATSVAIDVMPLMDAGTEEDTTLVLTLAEGLYFGVGASAAMTIANLAPEEGYKTWIAEADASGNADMAAPANWSGGTLPGEDDIVLLDPRFSSASFTWDTAVVPSVKGWEQREGFTGRVEFVTTYLEAVPAGRHEFVIDGDVLLESGTWTHRANPGAGGVDTYRLAVRINGDLAVGENAAIAADGLGPVTREGRAACAHGGDAQSDGAAYGDPKNPYWNGIGSVDPFGYSPSHGGGAIALAVTGAVEVAGRISADGVPGEHIGASGGSIAIAAKSLDLAETGAISANGVVGDHNSGSGGRIALALAETAFDARGHLSRITAYGGAGSAFTGAAGTIAVRNPGEANGTLFVRNDPNRPFNRWAYAYHASIRELTTLPTNATWTFDAVAIGDFATLRVGPGSTLVLPNGFASVSGLGGRYATYGLMLDGGAIAAAKTDGVHAFGEGAFFFPRSDFAFDGDVTVADGGTIGALAIRHTWTKDEEDEDVPDESFACRFTVNGNLTVAGGGRIDVSLGGVGGEAYNVGYFADAPGGHGGQNAAYGGNRTHDSVFHPCLGSGNSGGNQDLPQIGAGAAVFSVSGLLTVDGAVSADGVGSPYFGASCGQGGGSLDITAGSLAGTGTISANGGEGFPADDNLRWNLWKGYARGGGGRVAVRLTGTGATFAGFGAERITATGRYSNHHAAGEYDRTPLASSAGTVYLQAAGVPEGRGLVVVRNTGAAEEEDWAHSVTCLPSGTRGDAAEDFRLSSLEIAAAARVKLYADLRMKQLVLDTASSLDLNGRRLKVEGARIDGIRLSPGTYTAADLDCLADSGDGATGSLVVACGVVFIIR